MWAAEGWDDYELLDAGRGEKLERWGAYTLRRPDPQAIWPVCGDVRWDGADAVYNRSDSGGGVWEYINSLPESWTINYRHLTFKVKPMQFKHTGIFPEQSVNWDWVAGKLAAQGRPAGDINILNLFAYTGAASVAAASAGAKVCHVDAAKGMINMAKENAALSNVPSDRIRYILDDVMKFLKREIRRNSRYDAVIMDPPAYGRGPGGELWKLETHLYDVVELCAELLGGQPLFFIINSYASGISPASMGNILNISIGRRFGGSVESGEIGVARASGGFVLPCGCCSRWERG